MKITLSLIFIIFIGYIYKSFSINNGDLAIPTITNIDEGFFNKLNIVPKDLKSHFKYLNGKIVYQYNSSLTERYNGKFTEKGISNNDWDLFYTDYKIQFNKKGFELSLFFEDSEIMLSCKIINSFVIDTTDLDENYGRYGANSDFGYWGKYILFFQTKEINEFAMTYNDKYTTPTDCPDLYFGSGITGESSKMYEIDNEDFFMSISWSNRVSFLKIWESSRYEFIPPPEFAFFLDEKVSLEEIKNEKVEAFSENEIQPNNLVSYKVESLSDPECEEVNAIDFDIKSFLVKNNIKLSKKYLHDSNLKSLEFLFIIENISDSKNLVEENNNLIALQMYCLTQDNYIGYERGINYLYKKWRGLSKSNHFNISMIFQEPYEFAINLLKRYKYFNTKYHYQRLYDSDSHTTIYEDNVDLSKYDNSYYSFMSDYENLQ